MKKQEQGEPQSKKEESKPVTREGKERKVIDSVLNQLINQLLTYRDESPEGKEEERTTEALNTLEKHWFKFCVKPPESIIGVSSWKKIRPLQTSFRDNALKYIEAFDQSKREKLIKETLDEQLLNKNK